VVLFLDSSLGFSSIELESALVLRLLTVEKRTAKFRTTFSAAAF
jgi:hypothetical protein